MTDSVETKEAQAAAEARVQKFRDALGPFVVAAEQTRMPMIFTDALSQNNALVFANDSFLALTGFDRDQVIGHPLDELLGEFTDRETLSAIGTALDVGSEGNWEMPCRRVDGTEFLAAVYYCPVRDKHGVICQNFLTFVELGGHIDRLLKQRNELHALYEHAPGFIATTDGPDHRFTFANASYKRLVGRENLVGLTVVEALPEIIDQGFIQLLDQVFETGKQFLGISKPIRLTGDADGKVRYVNFAYEPVRDARGRVTGLLCEGYDVTAEREAADELAALHSELIHLSRVNAMGAMATTLAHELNQPLGAISSCAAGCLRLLSGGKDQTAQLEHELRSIEEASHRAGDIIRHLRDFTRSGKTKKSNFDLRVAIGECTRLVNADAREDINMTDITPEGVVMTGDRIQIQQVLLNLLRNACDATESSSRRDVTVNSVIAEERIVVSVTDTGSGIPASAANDIFSWANSSKEAGMGLGLAISQTIVEAHSGTMWLEHSGPSGSTFCFSIPVIHPPHDPALTGVGHGR
ncbi:MAG: ATP-binding protein [Sphingomonas sp.]